MSDDTVLGEEEISFFNQCLIYVFMKLKEYTNARILADENITKIKKQAMFSFGDNE
jgi:hypothetical protein